MKRGAAWLGLMVCLAVGTVVFVRASVHAGEQPQDEPVVPRLQWERPKQEPRRRSLRPPPKRAEGDPVVDRLEWEEPGKGGEKDDPTEAKQDDEAPPPEDPSIFVKRHPERYRVTVEVKIRLKDVWKENLGVVIYLPYPESSDFQDVEHIGRMPGRVVSFPETGDDKFLRVFLSPERMGPLLQSESEDGQPAQEHLTLRHEYIVTLYDFSTNFDKITELHPYDTESEMYKYYTAPTPPYIDPDHKEIQTLFEELSSAAEDDLEYIHLAFRQAKDGIPRSAKKTGRQTVDRTIKKGGQGANLNAVFVSLLRAGGIPARMVMARRTGKGVRSWAEFYLEKHGWIPADPSVQVSSDRFFGKVDLSRDEIRGKNSQGHSLVINHLYGDFPLPVPAGGQPVVVDGLFDVKFWGLYSPPVYSFTAVSLGREGGEEETIDPMRKFNLQLKK